MEERGWSMEQRKGCLGNRGVRAVYGGSGGTALEHNSVHTHFGGDQVHMYLQTLRA